jgi:hypothetical protein
MKKALIIAGVCCLLIAIAVIAFAPSSSARRAWKDRAIAEISSRYTDSTWASNEFARLKMGGLEDVSDSDGWLSPHVIVMRNGEWLAYANICQKEDRRIHDLFLGRGSDGKWYYSTFHFCKGMVVLRMEEQSESLAAFAQTYYLRPFDGNSDECLQKTWPPGSK